MVRSSVSLKPTMPLNWGSVVKLEPMLNPLVTSSSVMGDTPVMNIRFSACSLPVVAAFITLKKKRKNPSPWVDF